MDFKLTNNQRLIRSSAGEFFEKECPKDKTRSLLNDPVGYDPRLWRKMVDLGFNGILIPEDLGGMQGEFMELTLLMEEIGKNLVPGPFFETVCLCATALMDFGSDEQRHTYLPPIAEKGSVWTLAHNETGCWDSEKKIQLAATANEHNFRLNGTKLFVPYAKAADHLLVSAKISSKDGTNDAVTVLIVDADTPGVDIELIPTAGPGLTYAVQFTDVVVPVKNRLGQNSCGMEIIDKMIRKGALLKAAEMAGGARAALDIALKYAKERIQFGRPIGSFQVLQHKLVRMLQEVDGLKHLVREAAWRIDTDREDPALNSMAKVKANNTYHRVCTDAVVIHGAIGWTAEMDISLYLLRSKDLENSCGSSDFHREIITIELESKQPDFITLYK